jgi:hypothetical protein
MDSADRAAVAMGLGFLILVGFIFWYTLRTMNTTNDFLIVWTAVGPIVGVVIGSIPAHFFRSAAKTASVAAKTASDRADGMADGMADMGKRIADMGEKMAHMRTDR